MSGLDDVQRASRDQFDKQSANYGKGHILADVDDVRRALRYAHLPEKARVLDIATGGGHTGLHLASLGHRVVASDLTLGMLDKVAALAAERGLSIERCRHAAEKLPYADGSFDGVTCRFAPHHFTCPASFIMEVSRVLKDRGPFILIDGTVEDGQPEVEQWIHDVEKLRDPSHHRFVTPGKWEWLCREMGLRILHREIFPLKQPNLQWYFETARTSPENREAVCRLISSAPDAVREVLRLGEENGTTVWWWQCVLIVAEKVRKQPSDP